MNKLLVAATLVLFVGGCSKSPEERVQRLFQRGLEQVEACEFTEADATFRELTAESPTSVQGLIGKGLVLESQLLFYDALAAYLAVIELEPLSVPARAGAARMYARLGRGKAAADEYARTAALPDADAMTKAQLVGALMNIRELAGAQRAFESLNVSAPDGPIANVLKARLQWLRREADSASETFGRALAGELKTAEFYSHAADYYETQGLADSAIIHSSKSLTAEGSNFRYRHAHFFRCLSHQYMYRARQVIGAAAEEDKSGSAVSGMRVFYNLAVKDGREAGEASSEFRRINDGTLSAVLYDIGTWWLRGDALACMEDLDIVRAMTNGGDYVQSFKDFMNGEIELMPVATAGPLSGPPGIRETARWKAGERELRLADALSMYRLKRVVEFDSTMADLLAEHGEEADWLLAMADLYADRQVRLYAQAETHYRMALQEDRYLRPALENWLAMYSRNGKFDKALEITRSYAYLVDIFPELALTHAALMIRAGEIDRGVELFDRNIVHVRGDMDWYGRFGGLLLRKGRADLSRAVTARALELNPDNPEAYLVAAGMYANESEFQTASDAARKGLSLEPGNISLQVQYARALFGMGEHEKAIEQFEELYRRARGKASVSLYYSHSLASLRQDLHKAGNLAREAILHNQNSLRSLLNWCYVAYQSDKFNTVRTEALKAVRRHPDSPEARFYLGLAHYKNGDPGAREQLEQAISLGLWGEKLTTAREILAEI